MSEALAATAVVRAAREAVWDRLHDPVALAKLLPGAEKVEAVEGNRFKAVIATKVKIFTVRANLAGEYLDADRPGRLTVAINGRIPAVNGVFDARLPFELAALPDGTTRVGYDVELDMAPALASLAGPGLRDGLISAVGDLLAALDRDLSAP